MSIKMELKMEHAVSLLFALAQKTGKSVSFVNEAREGPDHMPRFTVSAKFGDEVFAEGSGITKKAAKEAAAQVALQALRRRDHEEQRPNRGRPEIMQYFYKYSLPVLLRLSRDRHQECDIWLLGEVVGPPNAQRFTFQVVMGGRTFPPMTASTKKKGREAAAQAAVAVLMEEEEERRRRGR